MRILDKIEEIGLYLIEQDLPKVTYYEIYQNTQKVCQVKNNFDKVVVEWSKLVSELLTKQKV